MFSLSSPDQSDAEFITTGLFASFGVELRTLGRVSDERD
jgi:hypothetical protein